MAATLADVAAAAGVSRQVVSAVLAEGRHGGIRYSEETKERVLAAIETVGYRRNRQAAQMRSGRQGALAVLTSNLNNLPFNTLEWMMTFASERGQLLVLERLTPEAEDWAPRLLREHYADGVVVFETLADHQRETLARLGLPLVEVHSIHRDAPGCIVFDIDRAVAEAVRRFREAGARQVAFICGAKSDHFSVAERWHALVAHCRRTHLPKPRRIALETTEAIVDLPEADALLLNNDTLAPVLYRSAAAAGRRIGTDLHLISFDGSPIARLVEPRLPSFRIVAKPLAEAAISLLNAEIDHPGSTTPHTIAYQLENAP